MPASCREQTCTGVVVQPNEKLGGPAFLFDVLPMPATMRFGFLQFHFWHRQLHDRYIVIDLVGVEFGQGLDGDGAVVKQEVKMILVDTAAADRLRVDYLDRPIYTPEPGGEVLVVGRRAV